jgi:hypothetical protein
MKSLNFVGRRKTSSGRWPFWAGALAAALVLAGDAWAQLGSFNLQAEAPARITQEFSGLFLPIPDNSAVGVAHEATVSGLPGTLSAVQLKLTITSVGAEPMFNGDLFATLNHGGAYAVLLNRPGSSTGSVIGYADNGFNVTLADSAPADLHTYRITLQGSALIPISTAEPGLPLTGTWQPDGRTADPAMVTADSPRVTSLATFNGLSPNGLWTLFLADLNSGGAARLESWSLEYTAVPEPAGAALVTGAALLALVRWQQSRRTGAED